jgi:CRISPR-associated protein Cas8c/Csp2
MSNSHPLIKYGLALLMADESLHDESEINAKKLNHHIQVGLEHFRVFPANDFESKEKIKYDFSKIEKGDTAKGVFMAPNILSTDMLAKNTWKAAHDIQETLENSSLDKLENVTMSIVPVAGEFLSFSIGGGIGRGKPKSTLMELGLGMIATLTPYKPCMQDRGENTCIIPDLPLDKLIDFIRFFKDMMIHSSSEELKTGRVKKEETGKKNNIKTNYKPLRPLLFYGNFPNPPRSTTLGGVALLATIGEFCKEAEFSERAQKVLDSLKNTPLYLIKYGDAKPFSFNHYVIELAKTGNLRSIVDSIYYTILFNNPHRDFNNTEYQKFDLFSARFLQLFNNPSFKDFLAFRAEYPNPIELLFNTYFNKMENIDLEIVKSARHLGKRLNLVAYLTAKAEIKIGTPNYEDKLREQKAKVLVELESAAFSAKSGDALIAQVVTRAGRLSGLDMPEEADLFMEKTMSNEITLEQAKNLLIAFSRLKNRRQAQEENSKSEDISEIKESEIGSNANL